MCENPVYIWQTDGYSLCLSGSVLTNLMSLSIQVDGCSLDLANGPSLEGIAILNIPSIYGGTNLWGENPSQKKRRKAQKLGKKEKEREFSTSSMSSAELAIATQSECKKQLWVYKM